MEASLPTQERDWLVDAEFIHIEFQHGLPPEVGINGVRVEDVMEVALRRLERYQAGDLACAENAEAIRCLVQARDAMRRRGARRQIQGVFHTYEPHRTERTEDQEHDFSATGA